MLEEKVIRQIRDKTSAENEDSKADKRQNQC